MRISIKREYCKGCEYCIEICPECIFKESDTLNERGYKVPTITNSDNCIHCKKCELICPEMAIEVEKEEKQK